MLCIIDDIALSRRLVAIPNGLRRSHGLPQSIFGCRLHLDSPLAERMIDSPLVDVNVPIMVSYQFVLESLKRVTNIGQVALVHTSPID